MKRIIYIKQWVSLFTTLLALATVFFLMLPSFSFTATAAEAEQRTVYVSQDGSDSADGSENAPFKTLDRAFRALSNSESGGAEKSGGRIVVKGTILFGENGGTHIFASHANTVTVTGEGEGVIDFVTPRDVNLKFGGPIIFENITLDTKKYIDSAASHIVRFYPMGHRFEFGEGIKNGTGDTSDWGTLYILGTTVADEKDGIFIRSGSMGYIWMAQDKGKGDKAFVTISDEAALNMIFCGMAGGDQTVDAYVKVINGGSVQKITAAGQNGSINGSADIIIMGGLVGTVLGGESGNYTASEYSRLYISTEDNAVPGSISNLHDIFCFSNTTDGDISVKLTKAAGSPTAAIFETAEASGKAGEYDLISSFEMKYKYEPDVELGYYLIPVDDDYEMSEGFVLLDSSKNPIDAVRTSTGFIVSGEFDGKGYYAFDPDFGAPVKRVIKEEVKLPDITKHEGPAPVTPSDPSVTPDSGADKAQGGFTDIIILAVLSVVILGGGVALSMKKG